MALCLSRRLAAQRPCREENAKDGDHPGDRRAAEALGRGVAGKVHGGLGQKAAGQALEGMALEADRLEASGGALRRLSDVARSRVPARELEQFVVEKIR